MFVSHERGGVCRHARGGCRRRVEAEEAKTRAKLEEARARLDKAAREVAELSTQLGENVRHDIRVIDGGPRRAVLGIQVDPDSDNEGVRVLSVSPGGPAAEAGLRDSDVIIALDGVATTGSDPDRTLIDADAQGQARAEGEGARVARRQEQGS